MSFSSIDEINAKHNLSLPTNEQIILQIFNGDNVTALNDKTNYYLGLYHETITNNFTQMMKHYVSSNDELAKNKLKHYENKLTKNDEILCACGETIKRNNVTKHEKSKKHLTTMEKLIPVTNVNPLQKAFIESPLTSSLLIGSAGCGKTKTIIQFCIEKHKNKLIKTYNDFLIVTFSRKARADFIIRGRNSSEPKLFNKNNVRTFHSLAHTISKSLFNVSSESQNTIILSTLKNITSITENDVEQRLKTAQPLKTCKFIFIDEAQDINHNQYALAKTICDKLNISLILVGDPNQNIYQFQGGTDKYLFNKELTKHFLTDNYRSTVEIVEFCNVLRPYDEIFPKMVSATNKHGLKPIIFSGNVEQILQNICYEIETTPFQREEIAIIGSVKNAKYDDKTHNYLSIGLNLVLNRLQTKGIQFMKHYDDGKETANKKEFEIKKGFVNLLTSHGSKGLEFKKVLVINYHFTTQSKRPTEQEYNNFKYLWYVTLSRAEDELKIYVDNSKQIFPNIELVDKTLYTTENEPFAIKNTQFNEPMKETEFCVTDIITNNQYFNEDNLFRFNNEFIHGIATTTLFDINNINIYEHDKFASLYGMFIELLFMFYYYRNKNKVPEFVAWLKNDLINSMLFVDAKYGSVITSLKRKGIVGTDYALFIDSIDKTRLTVKECEFVRMCQSLMKTNKIIIHVKLDVFEYDEEYITKLVESVDTSPNFVEKTLFDIKLYFYQIEHESKYLLQLDFSPNISSLSIYFDKLNELSKKYDGFLFQQKFIHPNISLSGVVDILQGNKIIEIKFVTAVTEKHVIQTLLYYNNVFPSWNVVMDIEIWNLFDGLCYTINFDLQKISNWKLNCFLCDVLDVKMENNVFMLDLETNCRIKCNFAYAEQSEIIDRFVYEYGLDYVASDGLIKNKFPLITTHIHGITREHFLNADADTNLFKLDMERILEYCLNPILVAHNGQIFDFRVMKLNGIIDEKDVLFLDTKYILRLYVHGYGEISDKLSDIYNKVMGVQHVQTHRAKGDTMMIVDVCRKLGLTVKDFVDMVNGRFHE